jgi:hypothetical protein
MEIFTDAGGAESGPCAAGTRGLEEWRYEYGPAGGLEREEYRVRGELTKVTRYEGRVHTEELYRDGAARSSGRPSGTGSGSSRSS